ncbi:MAG: CoA transferase [Quisquiliibacterium sp.]
MQPDAPTPFAGLVVIELGHSVAAPFAGQILGELGAEVIKVEKRDGDDARKWGPPFVEGASTFFQSLNRNKASVVCDLRTEADREALVALIRDRADIVIQNLRPGQTESLGLDGESLRALKPSLIYCNLGAFGRIGPLADRPGYDPLMQAFGGIMSTTGEPGRPSVRVGASIVDMGTGMWAVIGILTALRERDRTGQGCVVDVSLFETAACWSSLLASQYLGAGEVPEKQGSGASGIVPYKAYATRDGEIVIAAGSDGLFRKLAKVVGRQQWLEDPRFTDNPARVRNQKVLYAMLDDLIAQHDSDYWVGELEAAGIPCAPVQNIAQRSELPESVALSGERPVPGPGRTYLGRPLSFDGRRSAPRCAPPKLGEHSAQLLPRKDPQA